MGSRLADLVFGPTLACGKDRGPSGRLAPSPDRIAPIGAGLTSKPHHAQRPTVALRGSFRLRLASTTERTSPGQPQTQAGTSADYSNGPGPRLPVNAPPRALRLREHRPAEGRARTRPRWIRWSA